MIIESNIDISNRQTVSINNVDEIHYLVNDLYSHLKNLKSPGDILTIASLEQMGQYNVLYTILFYLLQNGCKRLGYISCTGIGAEILSELQDSIDSNECYAYLHQLQSPLYDDNESYEELESFKDIAEKHDLSLIVIDTLDPVFWDKESAYRMAMKLKEYSKDLGVALIIVSHMWNDEEDLDEKHITLQQVSDSCLNLVSNVVMTIMNYDKYNIHEDENHESLKNAIDIDVYHQGHMNKDRIRLRIRNNGFALENYNI